MITVYIKYFDCIARISADQKIIHLLENVFSGYFTITRDVLSPVKYDFVLNVSKVTCRPDVCISELNSDESKVFEEWFNVMRCKGASLVVSDPNKEIIYRIFRQDDCSFVNMSVGDITSNSAIEYLRIIRAVVVAEAEAHGYRKVHMCVIEIDGKGVAFIGSKGAGKTS